jgi:hypothetical protein
MRRFEVLLPLLFMAIPISSQSNSGELRLTVNDPAGLALKSTVQIVSQGNDYRQTFTTNDHGKLDVKRLHYGIYQVQIQMQGFAQVSEPVEIRSALPLNRTIRLTVASVSESVQVSAAATLFDPYRAGSVNEMGLETIQNRLTALPGRSMQDLVSSEPGRIGISDAIHCRRDSAHRQSLAQLWPGSRSR